MKTSTIALILAVIFAVAGFFLLGWDCARRRYDRPAERPDTVVVEKWLPAPIPEPDSSLLRPKIVYLPRVVHDTTFVHDTTTVSDSVLVEVPITEKHYASDDYRATVRGFQPELVDIWIRQRETTIRVPYRDHWSFTVGPQVGYGITPQGWQPYAGAGITFGYSF